MKIGILFTFCTDGNIVFCGEYGLNMIIIHTFEILDCFRIDNSRRS